MATWLVRVALGAAALLFLTACSQESTEPGPSSADPVPGDSARSQSDRLWDMVVAIFPDAHRPEVDLVRYATPTEMAPIQVDCLRSEGFPATLTPDNGVEVTGIPTAQQEALAIAHYVCGVRYQVAPEYTDPLTDTELRRVYEYYGSTLIPCLEGQGFPVRDVPSATAFRENYDSDGWTPYVSVPPFSGQPWYDLLEDCPPWPDGLYG